jgi:hypothetical protein
VMPKPMMIAGAGSAVQAMQMRAAEATIALADLPVLNGFAEVNAPVVKPASARDLRGEAKMKGYEGEACGECGNFTLLRNGTCMKCDTCGGTSGCSWANHILNLKWPDASPAIFYFSARTASARFILANHGCQILHQRLEQLTVFPPARIGGTELDFTHSPLKLGVMLHRTKEEKGFDEGHRVRLPARSIIQEPFFFLPEH